MRITTGFAVVAILLGGGAAGAARADSGPPPRTQVAELVLAAGENIELGDYGEAVSELSRALTVIRQAQLVGDPLAARAEVTLGAALVGLGRRPDAVAHFRAALKLQP